jgi:Protein of unknown function (DUF992)
MQMWSLLIVTARNGRSTSLSNPRPGGVEPAPGHNPNRLERQRASLRCVLVACLMMPAQVVAQGDVLAGILSCDGPPTTGLLEVQTQRLSCVFEPNNGAPASRYVAEIGDFGPPVGVTMRTRLIWQVLVTPSSTTDVSLAGTYSNVVLSGATEGAVLRGSRDGAPMLRIVSVNGVRNPDFATSVTGLSLRPAD